MNCFNGTYVRIWLFLLKEGGWHSEKEIKASVIVTYANPSALMLQMTENNYIQRRKGDAGRYEYAVMPTCVVPRFLKVGDIAKAMA